MEIIKKHLQEAKSTLDAFLNDQTSLQKVEEAAHLIGSAIKNGNIVITCGNGGSMCDAMHFAEEMTGRFRDDRKALPAVAISDPSYLTCTANDFGYDYVFSRFVDAFGKKGDILLAISTSGNSANVIKAAEAAQHKGMKVIGLTGKDGGQLAGLCDVEIRPPSTEYADRAQEIHIKIIHIFIDYVEHTLGFSASSEKI